MPVQPIDLWCHTRVDSRTSFAAYSHDRLTFSEARRRAQIRADAMRRKMEIGSRVRIDSSNKRVKSKPLRQDAVTTGPKTSSSATEHGALESDVTAMIASAMHRSRSWGNEAHLSTKRLKIRLGCHQRLVDAWPSVGPGSRMEPPYWWVPRRSYQAGSPMKC